MSQTNPVIDATTMSATLVLETIEEGLAAFADEEDSPLEDPNADDRSTSFVLTSRPSDPDYPHVIVEADEESGAPLDRTRDVYQFEFTAAITVLAETPETMLDLLDGVRSWVIRETDGELREAGFAQPELAGENETWEDQTGVDDDVHHWTVTVTGLVHAKYPDDAA